MFPISFEEISFDGLPWPRVLHINDKPAITLKDRSWLRFCIPGEFWSGPTAPGCTWTLFLCRNTRFWRILRLIRLVFQRQLYRPIPGAYRGRQETTCSKPKCTLGQAWQNSSQEWRFQALIMKRKQISYWVFGWNKFCLARPRILECYSLLFFLNEEEWSIKLMKWNHR